MAAMCYEPAGSCPTCIHNRFDPKTGRDACFLQQDLTPAQYASYVRFGELRKFFAEREDAK